MLPLYATIILRIISTTPLVREVGLAVRLYTLRALAGFSSVVRGA